MKKFNEIKKLIIVLIICVTSSFMIAQNDINPKKENREALKIAFFTSKMNLNVDKNNYIHPIEFVKLCNLVKFYHKNGLIGYKSR